MSDESCVKDIYNAHANFTYSPPKDTWDWDVFGQGLLLVRLTFEVPWWRIILTKIFLGSVWTRIKERDAE